MKKNKIKLVDKNISVEDFQKKYPEIYKDAQNFIAHLQRKHIEHYPIEDKIKKDITSINHIIDAFNKNGEGGRYLYDNLKKWAYPKEDCVYCLKVAADLGDKWAQYDYANETQNKEERKSYLLASGTAGCSLALRELKKNDFFGHSELEKTYQRLCKDKCPTFNKEELLKTGKKELEKIKNDAEKGPAFSKILTIIGLLNSDDFDDWLVNARTGGGCGLGKIPWKNSDSQLLLVEALNSIGGYQNIEPSLMSKEEFDQLRLIAANNEPFGEYLQLSFDICYNKLFEGGLSTSDEVGLSTIKEKNKQ